MINLAKRAAQLGLLCLGIMTYSCEQKEESGTLQISSLSKGTYEIYKIKSLPSLQLISEFSGQFNKSIELPIGNYLVLTDCSHKKVFVGPDKNIKLTAHTVNFIPPLKNSKTNRFSIQCSRYGKLQFRQNFINRFTMNILSGKRELLAGMRPVKLDSEEFQDSTSAKEFTFPLSALIVNEHSKTMEKKENLKKTKRNNLFFVSPLNSLIATTQTQEIGKLHFILPGKYEIELNGTKKIISIKQQEIISITPATLEVKTGGITINNTLFSENKSSNSHIVSINGNHFIALNEQTLILPVPIKITLRNSQETIDFDPQAGEEITVNLKSLRIDLGCSPWEWSCLKGKEVQLFHDQQYYPYLKGLTDSHIFYNADDVHVGFLSSKGILYQLEKSKNKNQSTTVKVGRIKLIPNIQFKTNLITDLIRLEAINKPLSGHTLDIPAGNETNLTLVEGTYKLVQFQSSLSSDHDRKMKSENITVIAGETVELSFPYYVTERRHKQFSKAAKERASRRLRRLSRQYQNAIPTRRY